MAKITKLPSGSYHAQVYAGRDEQGKRKYKSITADTPKEVKRLAALYELQREKQSKPTALTLEQAMHNYTQKRINILSPSTIRGYETIKKTCFQKLLKMPVDNITEEDLQEEINRLSGEKSAKTVRNAYGLFTATMRDCRKGTHFDIDLPQRNNTPIYIPTEAEAIAVLEAAEGRPVKLPILFGMTFGMRRSEIVGLTWEAVDMERKTISIQQAIVKDKNNKEVTKKPKSFAGMRTLTMPDMLYKALKEIPEEDRRGRIIKQTGDAIYDAWAKLLKKNNLPHYRFHDLRHYFASVMYSLGIPPKYAARRMGHADETMINRVYAHIMEATENEQTAKIDAYFSRLQNKMQNAD